VSQFALVGQVANLQAGWQTRRWRRLPIGAQDIIQPHTRGLVQTDCDYCMRVVLQRVKEARVDVAGATVGAIHGGLVVLVGVTSTDSREAAEYLADKIIHLRIFPDDAGRMNRDLMEANGALLVVSQFTLYGDCRKGRRPSFDAAAPLEQARNLYEYFVERLRASNIIVETGVFQAEMEIHLVNDGPVTFILDSNRN
jgi:D-tyrosyl-tRNA(Tyr) deacylase